MAVCMFAACLLWVSVDCQAQMAITFTPDTPFSIPDCNGTIYFAVDGTYTQAHLDNNSWIFSDLHLINSPTIPSFRVSVQNCNIIITSFSGVITNQNAGTVRYNVTGPGIQTINFGLSPDFALNPKGHQLTVRFDNDLDHYTYFHPEGRGWYFGEDGTITVTGATAAVYISYRDHSSELVNANLPFYMSHPVITVALVLVVAIVLIGVFVKVKAVGSGGKL